MFVASARIAVDCVRVPALAYLQPDSFALDRPWRARLEQIVERHRIRRCSVRIRLDCSSLLADIVPVGRLSVAALFGAHNFASLDRQRSAEAVPAVVAAENIFSSD